MISEERFLKHLQASTCNKSERAAVMRAFRDAFEEEFNEWQESSGVHLFYIRDYGDGDLLVEAHTCHEAYTLWQDYYETDETPGSIALVPLTGRPHAINWDTIKGETK